MMRLAALALLAGLLAGCIEGTPPQAVDPQECRPVGVVHMASLHRVPGFVPDWWLGPRYAIHPDGTLFVFQGNYTHSKEGSASAGAGRIVPRSGALVNVTAAQVERELRDLKSYRTDRDYEVSHAFRARVVERSFGAFCGMVVRDFYGLSERYWDAGVADAGAENMTVATSHGTKTVYEYADAGPRSLDAMQAAFYQIVKEGAAQMGVRLQSV